MNNIQVTDEQAVLLRHILKHLDQGGSYCQGEDAYEFADPEGEILSGGDQDRVLAPVLKQFHIVALQAELTRLTAEEPQK